MSKQAQKMPFSFGYAGENKSVKTKQIQDENVWLAIYCATINCVGVTRAMAEEVADDGLEEFKSRFRK